MTISKAGVGTSAFVAAVCAWHERHAATAKALEKLAAGGARLLLPAHAIFETYSVLTRVPVPHRLRPADASLLIEKNLVNLGSRMVAQRRIRWPYLRPLHSRGRAGRWCAGFRHPKRA
jgi:predicted nucleic acid-binding protein